MAHKNEKLSNPVVRGTMTIKNIFFHVILSNCAISSQATEYVAHER